MTQKEKKLAARLLRLASDQFSNHGCNDIDDDLLKDWTDEEKLKLSQSYHDWNGDPEEGEDEISEDWILMIAIANKLDPE